MPTKFCPNCGLKMDAAATVCPSCGKEMPPQQTVQQPPQQPTYAVPPTYAPPAPAPYVGDINGKAGSGLGWITFLRVIAWIIFAGIIIAGLIYGIEVIDYEGALGIAVILGSVLTAFMTTAWTMVFLNNASNLRKIATNTSEMIELLKRK